MASLEAQAAARELDVDLEVLPGLLPVVKDMLRPESLPEGWLVQFDEKKSRRLYIHHDSGKVQREHPLASYYRGSVYMEQGGYQAMVDLELKHPPIPGEIDDMCTYLGVGVSDDPYLREVAQMAISAPLPDGWVEEEAADGTATFRNESLHCSQSQHPLDAYFLELIHRRRTELLHRADGVSIKSALASTRMHRMKTMQKSMPRGLGEAAMSAAAIEIMNEAFEGQTAEEMAEIVFEPTPLGVHAAPSAEKLAPRAEAAHEPDALDKQYIAAVTDIMHPGDMSLALEEAARFATASNKAAAVDVTAAAATYSPEVNSPPEASAVAAIAVYNDDRNIAEANTALIPYGEIRNLEAADLAAAGGRPSGNDFLGGMQGDVGGRNGVDPMLIQAVPSLFSVPQRADIAAALEEEQPPPVKRQTAAQAAKALLAADAAVPRNQTQQFIPTSGAQPQPPQPLQALMPPRASLSRQLRGTGGVSAVFGRDSMRQKCTLAVDTDAIIASEDEHEVGHDDAHDEEDEMDNELLPSPATRAAAAAAVAAVMEDDTAAVDSPALSDVEGLLTAGSTDLEDVDVVQTTKAELVMAPAATEVAEQALTQQCGTPSAATMLNEGAPPAAVSTAEGGQPIHWSKNGWAEVKEQCQQDGREAIVAEEIMDTDQRNIVLEKVVPRPPYCQQPSLPRGRPLSAKSWQLINITKPAMTPMPLTAVAMQGQATPAERGRALGVFMPQRAASFTEIELGRYYQRAAASAAVAASGSAGSTGAAAAAVCLSPSAQSRALPHVPEEAEPDIFCPPVGSTKEGIAAAVASAAAATAANANVKAEPSRERILVALRARPLPKGGSDSFAWNVDPISCTVSICEGVVHKGATLNGAPRIFNYDVVLDQESSTQDLFEGHVRPLIDNALQGINCTVFAYGQTGSGKTHTMFGNCLSDGAVGMALLHLFLGIAIMSKANPNEVYELKLSMLELYNEQLRDLLVPVGAGSKLALVDDPRLGIRVQGLSELPVADLKAAFALIERGSASRAVGSTQMNQASTRSHTVVRLYIETHDAITHDLKKTAIINFVDLAGSERLAKTGSTGVRFTEGTNINLSLLMLGTVVARLAEGRRGDFVPFRNSKLTRLLQPCLGGNARTAVVAVMNPSHLHVEETFNTLAFASRAMTVVNQVQVNRTKKQEALPKEALVEYQRQISGLREQLGLLKNGKGNELSVRLAKLEADKIRLLDILEGLTGQPQGDVTDDPIPLAPADLVIPPAHVGSNTDFASTSEKALRSIARIAAMGRMAESKTDTPAIVVAGGGAPAATALARARAAAHEDMTPQEIVLAVRDMRAERDELRRRHADMRVASGIGATPPTSVTEPSSPEQPVASLSEQVALLEGVHQLEAALGGALPVKDGAASGLADRILESAAAVKAQMAEMATLFQHLTTSNVLCKAALHRAAVAEEQLQHLRDAARASGTGDEDHQQQVHFLEQQLQGVRQESAVIMLQLDVWRGLTNEYAPGVANAVAGGDQITNAAIGSGNDHKPTAGDPPKGLVFGSAALQAAREAQAKAYALQRRLYAVELERDELQERLEDKLEVAEKSGKFGAGEGPPSSASPPSEQLSPTPPTVAQPRRTSSGVVGPGSSGESSKRPDFSLRTWLQEEKHQASCNNVKSGKACLPSNGRRGSEGSGNTGSKKPSFVGQGHGARPSAPGGAGSLAMAIDQN